MNDSSEDLEMAAQPLELPAAPVAERRSFEATESAPASCELFEGGLGI